MEIKLGDKIYFFKYGKYPIACETIIKITPTTYKTKNYNLKIDEEYLRIKGKSKWDNTIAELENPTNKALFEEAKKLLWFNNKRFSDDEKVKIYEIFNN